MLFASISIDLRFLLYLGLKFCPALNLIVVPSKSNSRLHSRLRGSGLDALHSVLLPEVALVGDSLHTSSLHRPEMDGPLITTLVRHRQGRAIHSPPI